VNGVLRLSLRIYERLLGLYPADLRRDFGREMVLAFADDMEAAWRGNGALGIVRVWRCALRETLTIALPAHKTDPCIVVPAASFALAACMQGAVLAFALHQTGKPLQGCLIQTTVLWPSAATALIALVVSWMASRRRIVSLQLAMESPRA
jgi:hypothetical protein